MTQNTSSHLKKLMTQACTLVINLSDSIAQYRYTDRFYRVNHKACNRFERRANAFRAFLDSEHLLNSAKLASSPPEVADSPTQVEPHLTCNACNEPVVAVYSSGSDGRLICPECGGYINSLEQICDFLSLPIPELVPCPGSIDWTLSDGNGRAGD
jgi:hypothetical protein